MNDPRIYAFGAGVVFGFYLALFIIEVFRS